MIYMILLLSNPDKLYITAAYLTEAVAFTLACFLVLAVVFFMSATTLILGFWYYSPPSQPN
jgi:hypothetical protein